MFGTTSDLVELQRGRPYSTSKSYRCYKRLWN